MKIFFTFTLFILSIFFLTIEASQIESRMISVDSFNNVVLEVQTPEGRLFAYRPDKEEVQRTVSIAKAIFIEAFTTTYQTYHQQSGSNKTIEEWLRLREGLTLESWLSMTFTGEYEEYMQGLKGLFYLSNEDGRLLGWLSYNWNPEKGELYLSQGALQADMRNKFIATSCFSELFHSGNLESIFPGIKDIKLITRKINTAARRLFTKCGFRLDEVIDPSVYGDSYDDRYIGYSLTIYKK